MNLGMSTRNLDKKKLKTVYIPFLFSRKKSGTMGRRPFRTGNMDEKLLLTQRMKRTPFIF